jgi:multidrug transporter EmrE-like cation transporter
MIWGILTVFANIGAQLCLKLATRSFTFTSFSAFPINFWSLGAVFLYGIGLVFWARALSILPLSTAYPLMSLVFIFVPLLSLWLFNERLSQLQMIFFLISIVGVVGFAFSSNGALK